jgi:hypothetical protein
MVFDALVAAFGPVTFDFVMLFSFVPWFDRLPVLLT